MKKFITLFSAVFILTNFLYAQYFQGSFSKDASDIVNLKIAFKMRPTGNITTGISYLEAAFRYPSATPAFTITNITSNTATFPGLAIQRFLPDFVSGGFTYVKFVFNTATIPNATYTSGTEYLLFTITTSLPANATPSFDMISNLVLGQYQFGVVDGAGNFIDPGNGPQLYGPGFTIVGNDHILPLSAAIVPVKFSGFALTEKEGDALLTWSVDNQDANASHFEIEKSMDGINFFKVGTVLVNLATGASGNYTYRDAKTAANQSVPMLYYRIKQIDKDKKFAITEIKSLRRNHKFLSVSLYPNPASQSILLSYYLQSAQKVTIKIIGTRGNTILTVETNGESGMNEKRINISKLPTGLYNIQINSGDNFELLRFQKSGT